MSRRREYTLQNNLKIVFKNKKKLLASSLTITNTANMKINRTKRRAAFVAAILACAAAASFSYAKPDQTQEKIRLMVAALQARDSGDLKASKQSLEELLKIAPNDAGVQRMLDGVNKDIERQGKGELPVMVSAEASKKIAEAQAAEKAAAEKAAAEKAEAERIAAEKAAAEKLAAEKAAAEKAEAERIAAEEKAAAEKLAAEEKAAAEKAAAEKAAAEEAAKPTPVELAMAEAARKQGLSIEAAYALIDEAYDFMDDGNWDEASKKLSLASDKLPAKGNETAASKEASRALNKAKASMAKERALIAMSEGEVAAAKTFAAEYAAAEEDKDDANAFIAKVDKYAKNPYNSTPEQLGTGYTERMKKVEGLIDKGRRQYLYGNYQGAGATFRQVETLDADNITAKAYQRLIAEKLKDSGRLTYLATRENMLAEVDKSWQRPQVYSGANVDRTGTATDSVIEKKLNDIIIPNVSFPEPGVTLAQAINTLSILSLEYDKSNDAKKGVNIVLFGDNAAEAKPVILTLRDQPLGQVLDWVTQQAGFQYDIEKDTVVVRKAAEGGTAALETLDFPLPQSTVTRMIGIKASGGGSGGGDIFGGGGESAGGAEGNTEEAIKAFLTKAGVEFAGGASLAFDGSKLWVTNNRRNLDKVRNILLRYSETKQVEIEAKFMEVQQGTLKEIGFNWNVSKNGRTIFNTYSKDPNTGAVTGYNNRRIGNLAYATEPQPISMYSPAYQILDATGTTVVKDVPESSYPINTKFPILPSTINMAENAANVTNTVLGVINGYSYNLIVNALEQKNGSDLLCAPKVTVISGSTASITVSQQMRYPESWGDVQSNVGSSSSSSSNTTQSAAGVTITPGTPQDFTTVDVGVVMEVTPNVEEDDSINLVLNPKVTEFEGFMEYGGLAVAISSGMTVTVPSGFIQPVFSLREVKTTVTVFDGATVVMGGLTREEVISIDDSVPVLKDIPWIGRLFQSKGETRQKRNLLIFVTANRISPGGSVGREQFQDMRPGSVYQSPVIVSPGGAVHRILEDDAK